MRIALVLAWALCLFLAGCSPAAPAPPTSAPDTAGSPPRPIGTSAPATVAQPAPSSFALASPSPSPSPAAAVPSAYELAFVRDGSIWLAGLDGRLLRLTHGGHDSQPQWSPDGSRLVFLRGEGAAADLYTVTANGAGLRQLTADQIEQRTPRWSPRGDLVVFVQARDDNRNGLADPAEDAELWLIRPDGGGAQKLVDGFDPTWSPDGARVAYATNGRRQAEQPVGPRDNALRVVELRARVERDVLTVGAVPQRFDSSYNFPFRPNTFRLRAPSWSPDGARLSASADGHTALALTVEEHGTDPRIWLLNYEGGVGRSLYAPRGSLLAIESQPASGYGHILLVDPSSGRKVDIGSERLDVSVAEPAWAPDGQRLALIASTGVLDARLQRELIVCQANGQTQMRVAAGDVREPAWNPVR